ncbi:MAG: UvrD-helicase domain-containing protein [Patescibacteria group bacterium]
MLNCQMNNEMSHLEGLNSKQREAVKATEGPLLILAGAGAGKTKTITHRVLEIIKKGVFPHQILAVTFTNKAAKEMRERIFNLIEKDQTINLPISEFTRPFISTFHSLGVHILRENSSLLKIPRHFTIYDRSDSLSTLRSAIKELSLDPKQFEPAKFLAIISKQKGEGISLSYYEERASENYLDRILLSIWKKYEEKLLKDKSFDFDDLLLVTKDLLKKNENVRKHYQNIWHYIHIDEYQDTNKVQYEITKLLTGKEKNVCVVGDIDQSIYSWRGADFKNIMRFEKDYPESKTILLEQNYRSSKIILKAANSIIEKNTLRKDKKLFTENAEGEKISLFGSYDEVGEALFVAEKIKSLLREGKKTRDFAVLYRANFQSRILEETMLKENIPYQVLGTKFYERKEVKDIISYLRASLDENNLNDFRRIVNTPPRGIGKTTLLKIIEKKEGELPNATKEKIFMVRKLLAEIKNMALNKKLSETIMFIIEKSGLKKYYEGEGDVGVERLENMFELISVSSKYDSFTREEALDLFLTECALSSDQDDLKEEKEGVRLMTVHAAKGLEFDYCFITGLEEGLFPHEKPEGKKNLEEKEEERRLFYVALTRARKKLFLTYSSVRSQYGTRTMNIPSSFIDDIAPEILENEFGENDSAKGKVIYLE